MKMNKKGLIGIVSAIVAGAGVLVSYLETKNNEEFLDSIEKRISDVEKFYSNEDDGSEEGSEETES